MKKRNYDFDDINLIPQYGIVDSRSMCDTTCILGDRYFKLPVVPANMQSIMSMQCAFKLALNGYFYIMHRFDIDIYEFSKYMKEQNQFISISIGVNEDSYELIKKLYSNSIFPDYITIDIAHGHSQKMKNMITFIREYFPVAYIIAGNIATTTAVKDLELWGADCAKVGIASGEVCITAMQTGFGTRGIQASAIKEVSNAANIAIIADGGVKHPCDIAKALVLGADMVMAGSLFSGLSDSPSTLIEVVNDNGEIIKYREYWGSASEAQSGKINRIEGIKKRVSDKGITMLEQMDILTECLQSSISYAGGKNLTALDEVDIINIKE